MNDIEQWIQDVERRLAELDRRIRAAGINAADNP